MDAPMLRDGIVLVGFMSDAFFNSSSDVSKESFAFDDSFALLSSANDLMGVRRRVDLVNNWATAAWCHAAVPAGGETNDGDGAAKWDDIINDDIIAKYVNCYNMFSIMTRWNAHRFLSPRVKAVLKSPLQNPSKRSPLPACRNQSQKLLFQNNQRSA
jgi:hypothetical protein